MKQHEIKKFVDEQLASMSNTDGIQASDVFVIAVRLADEIAKQNTAAFVDQLMAEGWEQRTVGANTKVWEPGDTYEIVEIQVFKGQGLYQVFIRPKPGENDEKHSHLNGNHATSV